GQCAGAGETGAHDERAPAREPTARAARGRAQYGVRIDEEGAREPPVAPVAELHPPWLVHEERRELERQLPRAGTREGELLLAGGVLLQQADGVADPEVGTHGVPGEGLGVGQLRLVARVRFVRWPLAEGARAARAAVGHAGGGLVGEAGT